MCCLSYQISYLWQKEWIINDFFHFKHLFIHQIVHSYIFLISIEVLSRTFLYFFWKFVFHPLFSSTLNNYRFSLIFHSMYVPLNDRTEPFKDIQLNCIHSIRFLPSLPFSSPPTVHLQLTFKCKITFCVSRRRIIFILPTSYINCSNVCPYIYSYIAVIIPRISWSLLVHIQYVCRWVDCYISE